MTALTKEKNGNSDTLAAIADKHKDKNTPLWIDIDKQYTDIGISFTEGIDLIKWLRVKDYNGHIIVTSFLPLTYWLKMKPSNAILGSKGITFVQLPNERLKADVFETTKTLEKANPDELKALFRVEFDLKKIRHDEANIYGLQKLNYWHNQIDPKYTLNTNTENLEHHILEYIFKEPSKNTFSITNVVKNKLENSLSKIQKEKWSVIYIDDKANAGWGELLKSILGTNSSLKILSPNTRDNCDTFISSININNFNIEPNLLIIDLKLFKSENDISDYSKLTSYKIVQKFREKYPKLKVMYFTASNDLSKFRKLLDTKKYNPQLIYTKQGLDQMLNEKESFDKYKELINSLGLVLKKSEAKKFVENLQIINIIEEKSCIVLKENLENALKGMNLFATKDYNKSLIDDNVKSIYIDTNIFLEIHNYKPLMVNLIALKSKIVILATVLHELKKLSEDDTKKPLEAILASFFYKFLIDLKFEIIKENLSQEDLDIITNSKQHNDGFADNHIVETIKNVKNSLNVIITKDKNLTSKITNLKSKSIVINSILKSFEFKNTDLTNTLSNSAARNTTHNSKEKIIQGVFTHEKYKNCYCISLKGEKKWLIINKSNITDIDLISNKNKLIGKKLNPNINDIDLIAFIKSNIQ